MTRKIAVVGLGYVGLHTALAFGAKKEIIAFDINEKRIEELKKNYDVHNDFSTTDFENKKIKFTSDPNMLDEANFYIVAVPTPVKKSKEPDFSYLVKASSLIGKHLKPGDIVVYESTVYPGATEEKCLTVLEKTSNLKCGNDFSIGYSPERINPGDKLHTFTNTVKVVAGSDAETLAIIKEEYGLIIKAGILPISSIKAAEAVKIIENMQRDVNIAFINEVAQFLHLLDIDTEEVLKAAQTKWNFIPLTPGFVGGHCIGVDPYYVLFKAHELDYYPELISAARKINEQMSQFVATEAVKLITKNQIKQNKAKIAILGFTYKENWVDIRNSKVADLVKELESCNLEVFLHDPVADQKLVENEYGIKMHSWEEIPQVALIIVAVAHQQFVNMPAEEYLKKLVPNGIIMDIKGILEPEDFKSSGVTIWRL